MAAPKENKNAEKWTEDKSIEVFNNAIELAKTKYEYNVAGRKVKGFEYHFIGEIATQFDLYPDLFKYLAKKFESVKELQNVLLARLESNCFSDSKKGIIKEATAIMNLKSNYRWTDRVDNTSKDEKINSEPIQITFKRFKEDK